MKKNKYESDLGLQPMPGYHNPCKSCSTNIDCFYCIVKALMDKNDRLVRRMSSMEFEYRADISSYEDQLSRLENKLNLITKLSSKEK